MRKEKAQQAAATPVAQPQAMYPDLVPAITLVRERLAEAPDDRRPLLDKWLQTLQKIEKEMRHYERLTALSGALTGGREEGSQ